MPKRHAHASQGTRTIGISLQIPNLQDLALYQGNAEPTLP